MHVNKAHAALLIASAGALTGGTQKKPFPKLRPLKSALAAKPDLFGINEEDALLNSKREGQTSFRGAFEKAAFLNADVFGFKDEAKRSAPRPRPANARTLIDRSDAGTLLLTVPPAGLGGSTLMGAAFSAAWFSAIVPATAGMVATGAVLGSVFMAPFWLAGGAVLKTTLVDPAKKTTLSIGRYAWELSQTLPGGVAVSSDRGATDELAGADVAVTVVTNGVPQYACRLVAGARAWGLGDGLPRGELEWVASEINDQLSSFAGGEDLLAPPPGRVS